MSMDVIVDLAAAVICFAFTCHPVLIGKDTPRGEYHLTQYAIRDPRYGGDLLVFKHDRRDVYAIHRVFEVKGQNRLSRIKNADPKQRADITAGCINVTPEVYKQLVDCCSSSKVVIK